MGTTGFLGVPFMWTEKAIWALATQKTQTNVVIPKSMDVLRHLLTHKDIVVSMHHV